MSIQNEKPKTSVLNRKSFIALLGVVGIGLITQRKDKIYYLSKYYLGGWSNNMGFYLMGALKPISDVIFEARSKEHKAETLIINLKSSSAIDKDENIDLEKIRSLAHTDEIVTYNGKYYTQTELDLYTLAFQVWG